MIMLDKMIEDLLEEPVVDNNEIVFTSRAVELIHEISEKCKGIQIVEQTREQAEEYAKGESHTMTLTLNFATDIGAAG